MPTTAKLLKESIADAELDPLPIPEDDVVSGNPETSSRMLWSSDDGTLFNGIWQSTPGTFMLDHPGETIAVLQGRATLTMSDGDSLEITAGDIVYVPEGARVKWEVHETVRKAFHCYDSTGKVLSGG